MAYVSKIKLPNGTTYDIKSDGSLPLSGGTLTGGLTAPVIYSTGSLVNNLNTDDSGSSYATIRHVKNASENNEMLHYYRNDATNNISVYKVRIYNPSGHSSYVDFNFMNNKGTPQLLVGSSQVAVIKSIAMTQAVGNDGCFYIFGNNNTYNSKKIVSIDLTSSNTNGNTVEKCKNTNGQWVGYIHLLTNYSSYKMNTNISYTVYYMD